MLTETEIDNYCHSNKDKQLSQEKDKLYGLSFYCDNLLFIKTAR